MPSKCIFVARHTLFQRCFSLHARLAGVAQRFKGVLPKPRSVAVLGHSNVECSVFDRIPWRSGSVQSLFFLSSHLGNTPFKRWVYSPNGASSEGTADNPQPMFSRPLRDSRPIQPSPNAEALGYFRSSLRDNEEVLVSLTVTGRSNLYAFLNRTFL